MEGLGTGEYAFAVARVEAAAFEVLQALALRQHRLKHHGTLGPVAKLVAAVDKLKGATQRLDALQSGRVQDLPETVAHAIDV